MSNGDDDDTIRNCVLEVCCGEDGKQERAIRKQLQHDLRGMTPADTDQFAAWLARSYDLAPKGSLYALKQEIARLARGSDYTD